MGNRVVALFGGTGFIGKHYQKKGYQVEIVPRNQRESPYPDILYMISTVDNYNMFEAPMLDVNTNISVLIETLEANRKKYGRGFTFNFVSSFFVYGNNELPFREDMLCNPMGFYSITKFAAERIVETYSKTYGNSYRILRLANVYGEGDNFSNKKNAFQYLLDKLQNNEEVPIYGDGHFYRDMIYVGDVVEALHYCTYAVPLNDIYNIGTGMGMTWYEILLTAKSILNSTSEFKFVDVPAFHNVVGIKNAYLDVSKLRNLGWEYKTSISEGIMKLCENQ